MSDNVREIIKKIRAEQKAFYDELRDDPNWTPQVAVVTPKSTSKSISGPVKHIDISLEYISGLTKNVK